MNRSQLVSWVLAGVCACGSAVAAEALPPSLRTCMSETDASRRLACFDRESARLANENAPAARQATPPPAAHAPAPPTAAPAAATSAAAAATAASAPSAPAPSAQDKFGYRGNIALAQKEEEERRAAEQVTAKVTELSTLAHGEVVLTLDNGQVWQQKPGDRGMRVKVGDEVTIKRGSLGSFLLTTKAKGSMRVTRVQ